MRWIPKVYKEWNDWFAWHPVECEGQNVWLETIERKVESEYCDQDGCITTYIYRFKTPQHPAVTGENNVWDDWNPAPAGQHVHWS